MIHILAHFIGDALAGEVEGDGCARPELVCQRPAAGREFRSHPVPGAVVRLEDFFFLEVGDGAGDVRLVALTEVRKTGGGDLALVAVEHEQVQGMCPAQAVLFHFFCRQFVPVSGDVENIKREVFKPVVHFAVLFNYVIK